MKRLQTCLAFFLLLVLAGNAADIYVSPKGSDANNGSKDHPLATVAAALRKARELRRLNDASVNGSIHIILRGGVYVLHETVSIYPSHPSAALYKNG